MRDLGWVEGQNVRFALRCSDNAVRLPDLATDLVRQKIDLIITAGTGATWAAKQATTNVPIVFSVAGDPVKRDLVGRMSRPGGNLTGFALGIYDEKQLQVLKAALPVNIAGGLPGVSVGRSCVPGEPRHREVHRRTDPTRYPCPPRPGRFCTLLHGCKAGRCRRRAHSRRCPADSSPATHWHGGVEESYAGDRISAKSLRNPEASSHTARRPSEGFARMAIQIDKILRGAKPADLPVEQPTRFELVINSKEAKALRLSIPRSVRLAADELIQ